MVLHGQRCGRVKQLHWLLREGDLTPEQHGEEMAALLAGYEAGLAYVEEHGKLPQGTPPPDIVSLHGGGAEGKRGFRSTGMKLWGR